MHCKDISFHNVDFPLTEKNISEAVLKWKVYVRTEYLILKNEEDLAVIRVLKKEVDGLFKKVKGIEVVSLPENTLFITDPEVDVLNVPAMAKIQKEHPGKTVVVEGMFSHINFVSGIKTMVLRVIDNIPPSPSKLRILVDKALSSGFVNIPIIPEYIEVDLSEKVNDVLTEAVMFPCKVSGLTADMPVYFLDGAPCIEHRITLIGCDLSKRIFHSIYGKTAPFINVCPMDEVPDDGVKTIIKCCMIKEGYVINGNVAEVPWGATVPEIAEAINELFKDSE